MDYGLRWDYGTYRREQFGRYASFSPTVANPAAGGHLGGQIFEATCNCQFANNYPYAIGPRLGAACQVNSRTVINAGFGVVYGANTVQARSNHERRNRLHAGLRADCRPAAERDTVEREHPMADVQRCRGSGSGSRCGTTHATRSERGPPVAPTAMELHGAA